VVSLNATSCLRCEYLFLLWCPFYVYGRSSSALLSRNDHFSSLFASLHPTR
jgi:hypothetical protein